MSLIMKPIRKFVHFPHGYSSILLSNLALTNFILYLSLHNLSFSSFVGGFAIGLRAFP